MVVPEWRVDFAAECAGVERGNLALNGLADIALRGYFTESNVCTFSLRSPSMVW